MYRPVGMSALGYTFEIDYGFDKQTVHIPLEKMAADAAVQAATAAVDATWGMVEGKMMESVPLLVDEIFKVAEPQVRQEVEVAAKKAEKKATMIAALAVGAVFVAAALVLVGMGKKT